MNESLVAHRRKEISFYSTSLSLVYCIISVTGILGNSLVVYVILKDKKMPLFPTNIFILNLAIADLVIMLIGVEEIVHHILNQGWLLGSVACKVLRGTMTSCLYASVLNLMAVCIERYIAILFPLHAHILCSKRRMIILLISIWISAGLCGLPTVIFVNIFIPNLQNGDRKDPEIICIRTFSNNKTDHLKILSIFRYFEFFLYYLIPIFIQIILYIKIYRALFRNDYSNHLRLSSLQSQFRKRKMTKSFNEDAKSCVSEVELINADGVLNDCLSNNSPPQKNVTHNNVKINISSVNTRKQVVKMLIACVSTYFICFSPNIVPLLCSSKTTEAYKDHFDVLIITLTYANSAANPILYSIFSKRFRTKFLEALSCF